MKHLLALLALLALPQMVGAMCAATTENLLRVEVFACQQVKIGASASRPPAHRLHKKGSSVSGALITGRVVVSERVWLGDERMAEYVMADRIAPLDESSTFFLPGNAARLCPALIKREKTFVTGRPCCDVLPGSGLCLVPGTLAVIHEEKNPRRWQKWLPRSKQ